MKISEESMQAEFDPKGQGKLSIVIEQPKEKRG